MTFKIKTKAAIGKMIALCHTHSTKGDVLYHQTAVQCLAHAQAHGDITLMDKLVDALPRGYFGKSGIRKWTTTYSPIRWKNDTNGTIVMLKKGEDGYKPFDIAGAASTHWNDMPGNERTNERTFNLEALINLVKGIPDRIDRAKEKAKDGVVVFETKEEKAMRSFAERVAKIALDLEHTLSQPKPASKPTKLVAGKRKAAKKAA